MKKIILIIAGVLLMSCGGGITIPDTELSTKEGLSKIKKILEDKIGEDKDIVSLLLVTNNPRECYFEVGTATTKDKSYTYLLQTSQVVENDPNLSDDNKQAKPIKLSSWNVDEFIPIKNEAIALIESKSQNFSDFKVEGITIYATKKGPLKYSFDIVATAKKAGISYVGKRLNPTEPYFAFSFNYNVGEKKLTSYTKGLED